MGDGSPMISVIVPAHNEELCIGETLRRIRGQGFRDYELVVVNNASTDRTGEIAGRYARVINEPTKGLSRARNTGARNARGEVLFFMDADTYLYDGTLGAIGRVFGDGSVAVASGPIRPIERLGAAKRLTFAASFNWMLHMSVFVRRPYFAGNNLAIRRSAFEGAGGFNESMRTCEDGDMTKRASGFGKAVYDSGIMVRTSARRIIDWGAGRYIRFGVGLMFSYFVLGRAKATYGEVRGPAEGNPRP